MVIPQNSLVDIISLDESLKGVSSADLPIGSYYLKELQTAPGWVLNETIYPCLLYTSLHWLKETPLLL